MLINVICSRFLHGSAYYQSGDSLFTVEFPECMVVHNNWIISREAKIYRFKEFLQWWYDKDSYYTSSTTKYMSYSNPVTWKSQEETEKEELDALKSALAIGKMLNRVVILPRFHCSGKECPLNSLLTVAAFDESFAGKYRENSFLRHPLVPNSMKQDPKNFTLALTWNNSSTRDPIPEVVEEHEIQARLGGIDDQLITFDHLHRTSPRFSSSEVQRDFQRTLKRAFHLNNYKQNRCFIVSGYPTLIC